MSPSLRTRFLALHALRWFPTGLLIPVVVLLMLGRGVTLAQLGLAMAVQSVVVVILELPTGGLADVVGARPVLVAANVAELASLAVLAFAHSLAALAVVWALQGVYRALESGPLEAWYVSGALAGDPDRDIGADLSRGGVVVGVALAAGSLASSALVAVAPIIGIEALLVPVLVALVLRAVDLVAIAALISPSNGAQSKEEGSKAIRARAKISGSLAEIPKVVGATIRLIGASPMFAALMLVELLWGVGLVGFETLFPPRLADVLDDPARAATLLGPVGTAAWLFFAAGSSSVPWLSGRLGPRQAAALLRIGQAIPVAALALLAGPGGLILAYLAVMAVHGASGTLHNALLHDAVESAQRTTALSANSMAFHLGAGIGSIALGRLATGFGVSAAILVAAGVLALAAPLYLVGIATQPGGVAGEPSSR